MKVNSDKTELCLFCNKDIKSYSIVNDGCVVKSKNTLKVLGVKFDSKLQWSTHIEELLVKCRRTLLGINLIKSYFTTEERLYLIMHFSIQNSITVPVSG